MRQYDVLCAGLMVMDVIATNVTRAVFDMDTLHTKRTVYSTGGDALNVSMNLTKLGAKVAMAGCVGNDAAGLGILRQLDDAGINHDCVQVVKDETTATSMVLCEPNGERHFLYYGGANRDFDGSSLTDEALSQAKILFIGSFLGLPALEDGHLLPLFQRAHALGLMTAMDACGGSREDCGPETIRDVLPVLDVFIPSEGEAAVLSGESDPEKAIKFFAENGVKLAGVKLGKDGCLLYQDGAFLHVPAYYCETPVDTTGAGDAFMSGFLRGLTLGEPLETCARMGCAMGNSCVRSLGATTHNCSLESIRAIMQQA